MLRVPILSEFCRTETILAYHEFVKDLVLQRRFPQKSKKEQS